MKQNLKISIIIPVYNTENYLTECLNSIVTQKYRNIEIICVNDGSTDKSSDIIQYFCDTDPRVILINKPHTNAGDARNIGLKKATGDYILFIDSDDFLSDHALTKLIDTAEQTDADIIISQYRLFNNKTKQKNKTKYGIHTKSKLPFSIKDLTSRQFEFTNIAVWNKLYKVLFLKSQNLYFKSYTCLNDMFFSLIAISLADRIVLCHSVTIYYRINVKNSVSTNIEYIQSNFFNILTEINKYLQQHKEWDKIKHSLLHVEQQQLSEFYHRISDTNEAKKFKHDVMNFISKYSY